jgi:RND family efflux transporter MFP subunit
MKNALKALLVLVAGVAAGYWLAAAPAGPGPAPAQAQATVQPAPSGVRAEGRVTTYPGAWVNLASEQPGILVSLHCQEKAIVHRGATVATLRNDEARAAVAEARAQVGVAEADMRLAAAEARRAHDLAAQGFFSQQAVDRADQSLASAGARLDSAGATARRLEAALDKSRVVAPFAGIVIERLASEGEAVAAGQALCTIADLARMRVEAEVDEFDAARVRVGDAVRIVAEGGAGAGWPGRVEEVPDAVTRPRLRPQDPAKPMDTRVLLVKVALPGAVPLKLGQRVEVVIGRL